MLHISAKACSTFLLTLIMAAGCAPEPAPDPDPTPDEKAWARHRQAALDAFDQGRLDEAARQMDLAIAKAASFAKGDQRRLESLDRRAHLYMVQGYPQQAAALYSDIRAAQDLPPEHPQTRVLLEKLAEAHRDQGQFSRAESLYSQIVATLQEDHRRQEPQLAAVLAKMSQTVQRQQRPEEAAALSARATGLKYYFQGQALYLEGDLNQAEQYYRRALNIQQKGGDAADLAATYGGLALLRQYQGNHGRAATLYDKALSALSAALGPEHPALGTLRAERDEAVEKSGGP